MQIIKWTKVCGDRLIELARDESGLDFEKILRAMEQVRTPSRPLFPLTRHLLLVGFRVETPFYFDGQEVPVVGAIPFTYRRSKKSRKTPMVSIKMSAPMVLVEMCASIEVVPIHK
jgi:hypothetical protein